MRASSVWSARFSTGEITPESAEVAKKDHITTCFVAGESSCLIDCGYRSRLPVTLSKHSFGAVSNRLWIRHTITAPSTEQNRASFAPPRESDLG